MRRIPKIASKYTSYAYTTNREMTVSFSAWNWKHRTAIRTVAFDGARLDKLTYVGLKVMGADLSTVTAE
jgi:hypothetical protein